MKKIFLTGATGNVGRAILAHLNTRDNSITIGVRDIPRAGQAPLRNDITITTTSFDFETFTGFSVIDDCDILFLLRPPQIGDVRRYIFPLLERVRQNNVAVVFLSVQGADRRSYLPHSKIEREILRLNIPHAFLRPSYFLENLTTTLSSELIEHRRIYLPSGKLKFNWISVDSIGRAAARVIEVFDTYKNQAFELTGPTNMGFTEIVDNINQICGTKFRYESPGLFRYIRYMRKQKISWPYIGIMLLLHFVPRFGPEPHIAKDYCALMGFEPESVEEFIQRHQDWFDGINRQGQDRPSS